MSLILLPLVLASLGSDTPAATRYPGAAEAFHCTFDATWDKDADKWPDGWARRRGPGFPNYVQIKLSDEAAAPGGHCLRVDLDGSGATAYSPPVKIGPMLAYVLEGCVKAEGLKYDRAFLSLTLFDADDRRLRTLLSQKVQATDGWQRLRIGPFAPGDAAARRAVIGLHVEPQSREDLRGTVRFADLWLGSLPHVTLTTNDDHNFFVGRQPIEIVCTVSAIAGDAASPATASAASPRVVFRMHDALGEQVAQTEQQLDAKPGDAPELFGGQPGQTGTAAWKPPVPWPGFYRVSAAISGPGQPAVPHELTLAVVEPCRAPAGSEFGWTVPHGDQPLATAPLTRLLGQSGVRRVKYPLWFDETKDPAAAERLIAFADGLWAQGIELAGLLSTPPYPAAAPEFFAATGREAPPAEAADIFTPTPKVWYPSLETVMARLANQVRWWQLGDDRDTSFVGYPELPAKIAQVKAELDRIGQDVSVGLGWKWQAPLPAADKNPKGKGTPWRFLSLSADPPLGPNELATALERSQDSQAERWVALEPLAARSYPLEVRAADLVQRIIACKTRGADAIFCPDPFSVEHGLMNADGTPGELLLPWRTAALMLGGATCLGSIELPHGSPNHVFARGADTVMLAWSEKPAEETPCLGDGLRQVDLWGRSVDVLPAVSGSGPAVRVGRLPTFVLGIGEPLARWSIAFGFAQDRLPSIFGRAQPNSFHVTNTFTREVSGRVTLVVPDRWKLTPKQVAFRLAPGQELQQPIGITFPYDADSGPQPVRADFELEGAEPMRFSVYRHVAVGFGDVRIETASRINDAGELEVTQRFVNEGDGRANFRCGLLVPDRCRLATLVNCPAKGSDVQVYRVPDGRELLGKTLWLRADEAGGLRKLNYRFTAEK